MRKLNLPKLAPVPVPVAVAGLILIIATSASRVPYINDAAANVQRAFVGSYGLEAPLSLEELAAAADLIVLGTGTEDAIRPFTTLENVDVPDNERNSAFFKNAALRDVRFSVSEYLKGEGPREISVVSLASSSDAGVAGSSDFHAPLLGETYVLFLERGDGPFARGYRVLGTRGVGTVRGDMASFEASFGDLSLDRLREAGRNAPSSGSGD